jgi:hypothetical protein
LSLSETPGEESLDRRQKKIFELLLRQNEAVTPPRYVADAKTQTTAWVLL